MARFAAALVSFAAASLILSAPAVAGVPAIRATWVTEVSASSAKFRAEINPEGVPTFYRFEYITDAGYQENVNAKREPFTGASKVPATHEPAAIGSGTTYVTVSQQVSALLPATRYHYRVTATNAEGPTQSPPHQFESQQLQTFFGLPDQRGWEMVSPAEKNGGAIQGFERNHGGGVLQAAEGGGAISYSSASSFGEEPAGAPPGSQYLSHRQEGVGWSSENITTPLVSGSYSNEPNGVPYQLLSTDLSRALLLNGVHCRGEGTACPVANPPLPGSGAPQGYQDYYVRDNETGKFTALVTEADIAGRGLSPITFDVAFAGSSPDLRHIVLSTCSKLTDDAIEVAGTEGCNPAETNLYEWSEGTLTLVNLLPGQTHGTPGAKLGAQGAAVSSDGSRVYFTDGGSLYVREAGATHQVDESLGGGGEFQTATPNGEFAFFTKAGHLYAYSAASHTASDLTPSGGVVGVLAASADGHRVYFATGAGIFLHQGSENRQVAAGPGAAAVSDFPPTTGTTRLSSDGSLLVFMSSEPITGYDNTDAVTGQPDSQVFLYDASGSGSLTCVSCNPTGERPLGSSWIPGAVSNGQAPGSTDVYKPHILSADGRRVFFDSKDALVPLDTNAAVDTYEWETQGEGTCQQPAGCLSLISSGEDPVGASFIDASADGSDVYVLTYQSLVPTDPGSADVYDARVGGGFAVPETPIECEGELCTPLPVPPEDPTVGTFVPSPGNPPVHFPKAKAKKHKKHGKKHRRARAGARRAHG